MAAAGDFFRRRRSEEHHLTALTNEVLDAVMRRHGISEEAVARALERIAGSFHYDLGNRFTDVDYSQYQNVCGYLHRGGALGAGLTRYRVLEAAGNCEELRTMIQDERRALRVVSLGGGPGNDALGFCSALVELWFPEDRELQVTVVDAVRQWEECVQRSVALARTGEFGNLSRLFRRHRVEVEFLKTTLPSDLEENEDYYEVAYHADVILVQRLLNTLELFDVPVVMEDIRSRMGDGALVLLINANLAEKEGRLVYDNTHQEYEFFRGFDLLYLSGDREEDRYSLLEPPERFGHTADHPTKVRIAVLCKNQDTPGSEGDE